MKKRFWIPSVVVVGVLALTACFKNEDVVVCTPNAITADRQSIDSFITANSITYLSYADGYYRGFINTGSGSTAAGDSIVEFKRTISAFNGNSLISIITEDLTTNNGLPMRFSDFQNATSSPFYYLLTNAAQGGILRQIWPSSANVLGYYGCQQQTLNGKVVPANSQIIVDIQLTTVKKGN